MPKRGSLRPHHLRGGDMHGNPLPERIWTSSFLPSVSKDNPLVDFVKQKVTNACLF